MRCKKIFLPGSVTDALRVDSNQQDQFWPGGLRGLRSVKVRLFRIVEVADRDAVER